MSAQSSIRLSANVDNPITPLSFLETSAFAYLAKGKIFQVENFNAFIT